MRPMSECWALGHKSYSGRNQQHPHPARQTDGFMQIKLGQEGQQNVTDRSGGQNVSQIGPGKGSGVTGKKGQQKYNSQSDRRVENHQKNALKVMQGNAANLLHALREE